MDIYKGMHEQSRIDRQHYLLDSLEESWSLLHYGQLEKARVIDLTMQTDDPENTVFAVIFVPFVDELYETLHDESLPTNEAGWERAVEKITAELKEHSFQSELDHAEETHVSYMNNEWVITYNANK